MIRASHEHSCPGGGWETASSADPHSDGLVVDATVTITGPGAIGCVRMIRVRLRRRDFWLVASAGLVAAAGDSLRATEIEFRDVEA